MIDEGERRRRRVQHTGSYGGAAASTGRAARDEIRRLREELLAGRGPGASTQEVALHTRERAAIGLVPTVLEGELVSVHADLARGDTDAIVRDVVTVQASITATVDELADRLAPRLLAVAGLVLGLGLLLVGVRRRLDRRVTVTPE